MPGKPKRGVNREKASSEVAKLKSHSKTNSSKAAAEQYDPDKPLTQKQRDFARFVAMGESVSSASLRAGYSQGDSIGYRLIAQPNIKKIVDEERRLYEEAAGMTRKKVMDGLLESIELAKLMAEPGTMVAGWREIGKMCGYYEPTKHEVNVKLNGQIMLDKLNKLSDEQLLELIEKEVVSPELLPHVATEDEPE